MTDRRLLPLPDGRILEVADTGEVTADGGVLVFHNGSPHTGALLEPVVGLAAARGVRVVTYARPSYGASTPQPGRTIADAAGDVRAIVDALGVERFLAFGGLGWRAARPRLRGAPARPGRRRRDVRLACARRGRHRLARRHA